MFAQALKDYVDHLNYFVEGGAGVGILETIWGSVTFAGQSLIFMITYLITFQWLWHWQELPALFRENYHVVLQGKNILKSSLKLEPEFYPILNAGVLDSRNVINGLLNAFFLALPCTCPQMVTCRAVIINGWPAAVALMMGTVVGQALYLSIILSGNDLLIHAMSEWHAVTIVLGSVATFLFVWHVGTNPDTTEYLSPRWDWWLRLHHQPVRVQIRLANQFGSTLALTWFENVTLGNYFGNLTWDATGPSVLETGEHWWLLNTLGYWVGLVLGMILWGLVWLKAWTWFYHQISRLLRSPVFLKERLHNWSFVTMLVLTMQTMPFYGADYLIGTPLGLAYQDPVITGDFPATRRTHYYVYGDADEDPIDIVMNNVPYDDDSITYYEDGNAITDNFKLESATLEQETLWRNRWIRNGKYEERGEVATGVRDRSDFKEHFDPSQTEFSLFHYGVGLEDPLAEPLEDDAYDDFYDSPPPIILSDDYLDHFAESVFQEDANMAPLDGWTEEEELTAWLETQRVFRERVWKNPVYTTLLRVEAVPFLGGQPRGHHISLADDVTLAKQRTILDHYLTSLQNYKRTILRDTYSFPKRVYNQQFKGNLAIIRMYDAVRVFQPDPYRVDFDALDETLIPEGLELDEDEPESKVLSYNQTLYNRWANSARAVLHEELAPRVAARERKLSPRRNDRRVASNFGEYEAGPLYFGWDSGRRKLLINTSRLPVPDPEPSVVTAPDTPGAIPYFKWQAYPKAARDRHRAFCFFDMPRLNRDEKEKWRFFLRFLEEEDLRATIFGDFQSEYLDELEPEEEGLSGIFSQVEIRGFALEDQMKFFNLLPQYDWAYLRALMASNEDPDVLSLEQREHIEIGQALPPKLNGVAWPGVLDNRFYTRWLYEEELYDLNGGER